MIICMMKKKIESLILSELVPCSGSDVSRNMSTLRQNSSGFTHCTRPITHHAVGIVRVLRIHQISQYTRYAAPCTFFIDLISNLYDYLTAPSLLDAGPSFIFFIMLLNLPPPLLPSICDPETGGP